MHGQGLRRSAFLLSICLSSWILFSISTSGICAEPSSEAASAPPAAKTDTDADKTAAGKPAAEKSAGPQAADEKSDAPKHAAGHATDPSLVFKTVRVTALRAGSDEPLAETKVKARYYWKNKSYQVWYTTDDKGVVDVELPTNRGLSWVSIESHPEKLVPVYHQWESRSREITPPAELKLQFEPAANIGGIVQDEAGKPIAKAKVQLSLPATSSENGNLVFTVATLITDAEGRWQCDTTPVDLQSLSLYITHPDYLQNSLSAAQQEKALHDLTAVVCSSKV